MKPNLVVTSMYGLAGNGATLLRGAAVVLVMIELAMPAVALELQAHRGGRGLAPENTLAAFANALAIGVDVLELDVGVTADDVVVVSHNPELNSALTRGRDGNWLAEDGSALRQLTLAGLKEFDVGRLNPSTRYATRYPDQTPADGERVPTLDEVIDLVEASGTPDVGFNVETKISPLRPEVTVSPEAFVEAVIDVITRRGIVEKSTLQSFDWRTLVLASEQAPELTTTCLTAQQSWLDNVQVGQHGPSPWTAGFDIDDYDGSVPALVEAAGCTTWSPYHHDLDAASLTEAHELGLSVVAWTVNAPGSMEQMIDLGVDGIITDYPDRLRAVMSARGLDLPAAAPSDP